jgi:pyruvate carboxylase
VQDRSKFFGETKRIADVSNPNHISAPMAGVIASIAVKPDQIVKKGDLLVNIEAMKMETGIHASQNGKVKEICVTVGDQISAKDLLIELVD